MEMVEMVVLRREDIPLTYSPSFHFFYFSLFLSFSPSFFLASFFSFSLLFCFFNILLCDRHGREKGENKNKG